MSEYVGLYREGKKLISANMKKGRVYGRFHGVLLEFQFNQAQRVLDSTFAFLSSMKLPHIDYLIDFRFGLPFSQTVLKLWREKGFENYEKYPQLNIVGIVSEQSPLWLQISQQRELLNQYEGRVIGVFKTKKDADAYLDELRGYDSD